MMIQKKRFTGIIPAAGRSKRFKYIKSKIFFKIKKKTMIEIILSKIERYCNEIIVILKPKDNAEFNKIKTKLKYKNKITVLNQKNSTGMAIAAKLGIDKAKNENFILIWSDQVYLSNLTIKMGIKKLQKNNLSFPIVYKKKPYTLIKFKDKKFFNILQQREENIQFKSGYSDSGFFLGKTKFFQKHLSKLIKNKKIVTKKTKEYDFLNSFKFIRDKKKIRLYKISNAKEAIGINYINDLK